MAITCLSSDTIPQAEHLPIMPGIRPPSLFMLFLLPGMSCHVVLAHESLTYSSELSSDASPSVKLLHYAISPNSWLLAELICASMAFYLLYLCHGTNSSVWFIMRCRLVSLTGLWPPQGQKVHPSPLSPDASWCLEHRCLEWRGWRVMQYPKPP